MLKGLSATFISLVSVMLWTTIYEINTRAQCEVQNIPCYTLVTMQEYYLGKPIVTLETIEAYVPALKKIGVENLAYNTGDVEAALKADGGSSTSRLYL